jgi:small-conductance mechanosensitive channel
LFSFFKFTENWAEVLFGYIFTPVQHAFISLINFLPNVFAIVVIFFLTKYALNVIKYIFTAIGNGKITINGFYKDWAEPTYKIVRFLVIVFAVIIVFPYLPGSDSPIFRGISVFVGVLISLGSTSAIANIVAGVVLTYMRPFKVGDIVKISETTGKIIEKTLLVTRMRTIKNVDITVPNAMVLSSHITNYSSSSQDKGLVVHTTITQGYEVPWQKIHDLLIKAAMSCENVLQDPPPFVLTKTLDDYYVTYEINAYTNTPNKMLWIYSELHQKIQELFSEAGLELLSPHYNVIRDGNKKTTNEEQSIKLDKLTDILNKMKIQ